MRWRGMFAIIVIIKSINDLVMSKTKVRVDSGLITMPSNDIMMVWWNKWQFVVWSNPPTFHFSFHFTNHDSNWVSNVHPCLITTQLYLGIWLCYHLISRLTRGGLRIEMLTKFTVCNRVRLQPDLPQSKVWFKGCGVSRSYFLFYFARAKLDPLK